ncbi:MAG: alpha,alpha-trehalose-phosphate synthase (UDP-forming) [Frankiaceae bacterium]
MADAAPDLPLILLSHRGPVTFGRNADGERVVSKGSGGLVTALLGLAQYLGDAVWICAAATEEDAAVAREAKRHPVRVITTPMPHVADEGEEGPDVLVDMIEIDEERQAEFYGVFSNPILWFIQHGLYGLAESPVLTAAEHHAFEHGYAGVNEQMADELARLVEERDGRALVLIQDYHFYLVADSVRRRCPNVVLSHFVHIPWPGPEAWRVLPPWIRERLLRGLLGSDIVAFHTRRYARNFLLCVQDLLGLDVDPDEMTISVDDRTVRVRHYPISVDPAALIALADSQEVHRSTDELSDRFLNSGNRLILRVDRTDPSKNVVRGFLAFGTLLDQHPELVGRVSFLALLQPSRKDVPEYSDYISNIGATVADINARHTREGQQPIDLQLIEDFPFAVAAYCVCDVLVVNALADGMNLVAKEFSVVNRRDGVLALSETTGAWEELGQDAVTLYPFDVQQQADALYEALMMSADERHGRMEAIRAQVVGSDIARWLASQLDDLRALMR